jgi:hypothetical protein
LNFESLNLEIQKSFYLCRCKNQQKCKTMCTVSIKVNDDLLHKAWGSKYSEVDMAEWMQQQIEAILVRMALATKRERQTSIRRIMSLSETDRIDVSLHDLEGILPSGQISFDDLRDEYLSEKYGV